MSTALDAFALEISVPIGPLTLAFPNLSWIQAIFALLMFVVLSYMWTVVWGVFKSALRICIRRAAEAFEVFPHNYTEEAEASCGASLPSCSGRRSIDLPVAHISKSTQSMVTYTSVRRASLPRFQCLGEESQGVWDHSGMKYPMREIP